MSALCHATEACTRLERKMGLDVEKGKNEIFLPNSPKYDEIIRADKFGVEGEKDKSGIFSRHSVSAVC